MPYVPGPRPLRASHHHTLSSSYEVSTQLIIQKTETKRVSESQDTLMKQTALGHRGGRLPSVQADSRGTHFTIL